LKTIYQSDPNKYHQRWYCYWGSQREVSHHAKHHACAHSWL